jgi:hypothetical protein
MMARVTMRPYAVVALPDLVLRVPQGYTIT